MSYYPWFTFCDLSPNVGINGTNVSTKKSFSFKIKKKNQTIDFINTHISSSFPVYYFATNGYNISQFNVSKFVLGRKNHSKGSAEKRTQIGSWGLD